MPNVPGAGTVPKGAVVVGVVAAVGVGGYLLYKHLTKPAVPAVPPGGATAYGYHAYGYSNTPYSYGYGYGYNSAYGNTGMGGGTPYYGYQPSTTTGYGYGGGPPTTNAQWGQEAESDLGSNGTDSIAAALAKYLTGSQITQAQYGIVQEAIAVLGYPPEPGRNNYPPKAHTTGGGSGGGNVAVPNVVGQETDAAMRALQAAGLNGTHPALKGGRGSVVTAEKPSAGTQVTTGSTVQLSVKEK